ncbi:MULTISPECIES: hypothetical protein [unclassified Lentimonas]|uniref:hypothetical protein n=1 Tax=unclassified Lentimonas TaxID=2630993 RepID=UPI0013285393|nr:MULTISPECIES: hypothetical protein [unclassified Lentimonas]CAA6676757.1 Unannotated [Lentimonas sp. CC4]CAA6684578.1 Unannotated [Lentimonas sp. CC6]CAA6694192.1 Unannotated [Lentimonas sp. CC10]CAA6694312.1 Unannotated [Lentimonas sp. CC19]CAA7071079.1 Unannotated [Lentimonas sp. CC11]
MVKSDPVEQLRTLNELLARTGASAPDRAEHARRALDFFSQEQDRGFMEVSLRDCADRLAHLHFGGEGESELAFAHWHVPTVENFSPLWIRQAIVVEMKKLAGRRAALLLVTGLREAVCPKGAYWTKSRQAQYDRVRGWIDDLACAWATRGSQLQVVVL